MPKIAQQPVTLSRWLHSAVQQCEFLLRTGRYRRNAEDVRRSLAFWKPYVGCNEQLLKRVCSTQYDSLLGLLPRNRAFPTKTHQLNTLLCTQKSTSQVP
jgi:hypothetical protein